MDLYRILLDQVEAKVEKMNSETLGRICAHAGYDEKWATKTKGFIRKTPIGELFSCPLSSGMPGRGLLETIAFATIICVAYDIVHQDDYQMEERNRLHNKYP